MKGKEVRYDVFVLAPIPGKTEKIWWRQTGPGNRWGNEGFSGEQKDKMVAGLLKYFSRSEIKVQVHKD